MENRCVCCGAIIPEGSHVCINCQKNAGAHKPTPEEKTEDFIQDWLFPLIVFGFILYVIFGMR